MKRDEFIKTSSLLLAGSMINPMFGCKPDKPPMRTNWAGNYTYRAKELLEPGSSEELVNLMTSSGKRKALGSRHCFNNIADSPMNQISTKNLNNILSINRGSHTVVVESGVRYGDLAPVLQKEGFALHNLASLPHITIAGACATATHGSGVTNGNLATAVRSLELVKADGSIQRITKDENPEFNGAVVGLGAMGIVSSMELDIEPTYEVRQDIFTNLPWESLDENFIDIMSAGYSVSLFTSWDEPNISQVWIKRRMDTEIADLGADFFGAVKADKNVHPIITMSAENCTEQLGVPGAWHDRLPHFKMGFTPSGGEELQSEYFVSLDNALDAINAIRKHSVLINPDLMITELRTIAADELWLSPCYGRDSLAIHFTWKPNWDNVSKILPIIEKELAPFEVRPHWGKLFTIESQTLRDRYPKFNDFTELMQNMDPERKFGNAYLQKNIYA